MSKKNTIISLFDYTGNWSRPWRENGYNVVQIDIQLGVDVLTWNYKTIPRDSVYGVLAACPCTDFSVAGSQYWAQKDLNGDTAHSIALVYKTLEIIRYFDPVFWCIENPKGRIAKCVPSIGEPKMWFQPFWYRAYADDPEAENYTKLTYLYGDFNTNLIKFPKSGDVDDFFAHYWKDVKSRFGSSKRFNSQEVKISKSATPIGFAYAFYRANSSFVPGEQLSFFGGGTTTPPLE